MTRPRLRYQSRWRKCRSCAEGFTEILDHRGRPPLYCRKCRKDYVLYPTPARRMRKRINQEISTREYALKRMVNELIAHRMGPFRGDEDDDDAT